MNHSENLIQFKMLMIIGFGGFIGSMLRYYISGIVKGGMFPFGTLFVNFLGSLALGFILFLGLYSGYDSPEIRNFFAIGLLGAFTTMSTFSFETVNLLNEHDFRSGGINIILNVGLSITGIYIGRFLASVISAQVIG